MAVNLTTFGDKEQVLQLTRFVQAARRCATDPNLDWAHHLTALKAAVRGERWLYIAYDVRLP